ncbi:hypothetical protein MHU86_20876 [Fragilaria crotonensis]|nr:hypothetical protein MHU86_20876 [Fragilaria crotonensis]
MILFATQRNAAGEAATEPVATYVEILGLTNAAFLHRPRCEWPHSSLQQSIGRRPSACLLADPNRSQKGAQRERTIAKPQQAFTAPDTGAPISLAAPHTSGPSVVFTSTGAALEAQPFSTLTPGSEFRPADVLAPPLLSRHPAPVASLPRAHHRRRRLPTASNRRRRSTR